jgi:uncharacterized membrane protein YkvA (DUF1232 family)
MTRRWSRLPARILPRPGDEKRVRRGFWPKLRRFAADLPFGEDAVAAYFCAFDRTTPNSVRLTLLAALAYFVLPADAVPDFLPMMGFADDASVLTAAMMAVGSSIRPEHREAARSALERLRGDMSS